MADVWAVKSGNWSDTTLWNTGSLPTTVDDVFANNFTVYVDGNFQVLSIRNKATTGITAGGRFILNNETSLSANVEGSGVTGVVNSCLQFLSAAPASATLYGDISSNNTAIIVPGAVYHNGSGTLTIYGNLLGGVNNAGNANSGIITNNSTGTLTMFGSVSGGTPLGFYGIVNNSSGTVNVSGNVTAGVTTAGTNCQGIRNMSTGTVNITGNVTGTINQSDGVLNGSTGTVNILGNVIAGSSSGISNSSTGTVNITGNIIGGSAVGADNASNGILTIIGNVAAGISHGVRNNGNNILTITGNVTGSPVTTNVAGALNNSTGTLRINGNVFAWAGWGANNASTGTLVLSGNVTGGNNTSGIINNSTGTSIIYGNVFGTLNPLFVFPLYGAQNNSTGTLIVSGNAVAGLGNTAYGAYNNTTGILRVKRAVGNDWGLGYTLARAGTPGVFSNAQGSQTFVEELELGPRGQWPTGGVIFFTPNPRAASMFETDTFQPYTLIQSNSADNLVPPVSSVRQGTTYNLSLSTGSCIIPPVSSVACDTLVDNLTGTAVLTPQTTWNHSVTGTDIDSMGGRLRNALNTQAANTLINSFNP